MGAGRRLLVILLLWAQSGCSFLLVQGPPPKDESSRPVPEDVEPEPLASSAGNGHAPSTFSDPLAHVEPSRAFADLVVSGEADPAQGVSRVLARLPAL